MTAPVPATGFKTPVPVFYLSAQAHPVEDVLDDRLPLESGKRTGGPVRQRVEDADRALEGRTSPGRRIGACSSTTDPLRSRRGPLALTELSSS